MKISPAKLRLCKANNLDRYRFLRTCYYTILIHMAFMVVLYCSLIIQSKLTLQKYSILSSAQTRSGKHFELTCAHFSLYTLCQNRHIYHLLRLYSHNKPKQQTKQNKTKNDKTATLTRFTVVDAEVLWPTIPASCLILSQTTSMLFLLMPCLQDSFKTAKSLYLASQTVLSIRTSFKAEIYQHKETIQQML